MYVKTGVMAWATMALIAFLTACGPVKFSASSENIVDETGVTPTPTPTTTPTTTPVTVRDVHYNSTVASSDYKLDIVLIIDDSNSMLEDNQKLASKLSGLVNKLQSSNIDWQMCATVTRAINVGNNQMAWGASVYWQKSPTLSYDLGMVLKKGTSNLSDIFTHTINRVGAGWENSDDERGIKAAYRHVYNGDLRFPASNNGCYRSDSAVTYILISDEDERSIGGDASQKYYTDELKPLEEEDKPQVFVNFFKETFGSNRRFTFNSIIVKPNDKSCKDAQDASKIISHYGVKYAELSNLTGGGIGSICASDFSTNLDLFFGKIQNSLSSVPLECAPYNGAITVVLNPNNGAQGSVVGSSLVFNKAVPAGTNIDLKYKCADSRLPSSFSEATPLKQEGFFTRIVNFFKNLF